MSFELATVIMVGVSALALVVLILGVRWVVRSRQSH
jgi:hypothetical protein